MRRGGFSSVSDTDEGGRGTRMGANEDDYSAL